ncbi:MAG: type II toxin-antitoxin system VapB family antitoxin [Gammaproteobacteria bacterium]|nr:type II toxin-antitoxin system VapB family antitoxin [Gammaproteobacteria bacterium]
MSKKPDYQGIAKIFWSGRSQAVRLPAECRFDTSEVEIVKNGDQLTLRPIGKNWTEYFGANSRGTLPKRKDLPLLERDAIR